MADVLRIFLLILGALLVFVSYWLVSEALMPKIVEKCRVQYETHAIRSTLVGLLVFGPLFLIAIAFLGKSPHPLAKVLGVVLIAVPVLLGLIGSTGLCRRIGQGLASPVDEAQPWRCVLRGGILLSFTFLFPFLGWFFVLPFTIISGLGALVGARWDRQGSNPALDAVEPLAPPSPTPTVG